MQAFKVQDYLFKEAFTFKKLFSFLGSPKKCKKSAPLACYITLLDSNVENSHIRAHRGNLANINTYGGATCGKLSVNIFLQKISSSRLADYLLFEVVDCAIIFIALFF